ncbi:MAG: metallophosphoesterase family protein [Anaerolineales bacterium]|nr:metallophosphoesterase family protein [Anaerolineales bacterium]
MRIGVLSDTHNNIGNLRKALQIFREKGITTLVHCGDMANIATAQQMAGFNVIYVSGNTDSPPEAVKDAVWLLDPNHNEIGNVYSGELDGVKIAATHGHLTHELDKLIKTNKYAFVFHGHTHRKRNETIKQTRVINPGALGGARYEPRSIAIVDLVEGHVKFLHVTNY